MELTSKRTQKMGVFSQVPSDSAHLGQQVYLFFSQKQKEEPEKLAPSC